MLGAVNEAGIEAYQDPIGVMRTLDSKAMRKVEDGQDMAFTLENSSLSAGSTTAIVGRVLVKLH